MIDEPLLLFLLRTINLNKRNISYQQLQQLTCNHYSNKSVEEYSTLMGYLLEHHFIALYPLEEDITTVSLDHQLLELTFYGEVYLRKKGAIIE